MDGNGGGPRAAAVHHAGARAPLLADASAGEAGLAAPMAARYPGSLRGRGGGEGGESEERQYRGTNIYDSVALHIIA